MEKQQVQIRGIHKGTAPRYTLGPLGLFKFGQRVEFEGKQLVVLSIDFDGAGVAWEVDHLNKLIDERMAETGEDRKAAKAHVINVKRRARTAPHPAQYHADVERIQAMMDHQAAVNRERLELVA
jgi:hypothetical protein